jgi:hypothetical protein
MGAALVFPLVVAAMLLVAWVAFGARKTRQQAESDRSLPAEPYARRDEEIARLRADHAEADPARTEHPARRP